MKRKLDLSAATVLLLVSLCATTFAGIIPTIPAPEDPSPATAAAEPTPTPTTEQSKQAAAGSGESLLDWLLRLING